jgi:hypothetical protein
MRPHDLGVILVVSLWSPIQGLEKERWDSRNRDNNTAAMPEGTASTACHRGSRPDTATGAYQAQTSPARPKLAREAPASHAAARRLSAATTCNPPSHHLHPQGAPPPCKTVGPPQPRWAPKGPDLGRLGAAGHLHRRVAPQATAAPPYQRPPGLAGTTPPSRTAADRVAPPPAGAPATSSARAGSVRPAAASIEWEGPGGPHRRRRQGRGGEEEG